MAVYHSDNDPAALADDLGEQPELTDGATALSLDAATGQAAFGAPPISISPVIII